jgi:5-methylcytosine-specific restriction endonuclease McrA
MESLSQSTAQLALSDAARRLGVSRQMLSSKASALSDRGAAWRIGSRWWFVADGLAGHYTAVTRPKADSPVFAAQVVNDADQWVTVGMAAKSLGIPDHGIRAVIARLLELGAARVAVGGHLLVSLVRLPDAYTQAATERQAESYASVCAQRRQRGAEIKQRRKDASQGEWAAEIIYGGRAITLCASREKLAPSRPCSRGHVWPGADFGLRRLWGDSQLGKCLMCGSTRGELWWLPFADWDASGFKKGQKLGRLCRQGHRWNGQAVSLRRDTAGCGHCIACEQERQKSDAYKVAANKYQKAISKTSAYKMGARERRRRRRAAIKGNWNQRIPRRDLFALRRLFDDCCAYCGTNCDTEFDHFYPVAKGGPHVLSNLLPACKRCNSSKQDSDPEQWCRRQSWFTEKKWRELLAVMGKKPARVAQLSLI